METDITPEQISRTLNIRTIYEFVETMDRRQDDLHMIQEAIEVNGHIAQLGAAGDYGLNIGHGIRNNQEAGLIGARCCHGCRSHDCSGVDARMAGAMPRSSQIPDPAIRALPQQFPSCLPRRVLVLMKRERFALSR